MYFIPKATHTWEVITKTGSGHAHETSSDVRLKITGTGGTSRELTITEDLNKGEKQTFIFTNVKDLGEVTSLYITILGNNGWFLEHITLRSISHITI